MAQDLNDDSVDVKKSTLASELKKELHRDGVRVKTFRCTVFTLPRGTLHRVRVRVERLGTLRPNDASSRELSILA